MENSRVLTEQEQNEFIGKMLDLSPIELAESLILIYGNELIKGVTNDLYNQKGQEILDKCREELVKLDIQYKLKVGYTMRNLIQNKGDMREHCIF